MDSLSLILKIFLWWIDITPLLVFFIIILIIRHFKKMSRKLRNLENRLNQIERAGSTLLTTPVVSGENKTILAFEAKEEQRDKKEGLSELKNSKQETFYQIREAFLQKASFLKQNLQIPSLVKENWLGVTGSIACIIGVVFFGITSGLFSRPEIRVAAMVLLSMVLFGIGKKLKQVEGWSLASGIFASTAGGIILFAALGAGGIEGLRFIQSSWIALGVLCLGLGVNAYLSFKTSYQTIASLHVLLSLIALCVAPQAPVFLPLGALIASLGLFKAYKAKWDLHLLLIVLGFSLQNLIWVNGFEQTSGTHILGIACSIGIGVIAAALHYSKKYQSPKLEVLPLVAHLSNWIFCSLNIYLHAQFLAWGSLFLFSGAIAGFILANIAKKKGIAWLYQTDTTLSQVLILTAIASLHSFSIRIFDLSILGLAESILFTFIAHSQKEKVLARIGYLMQIGISLIIWSLFLYQFKQGWMSENPGSTCLRMALSAILCLGFYIYSQSKRYTLDTFSYLFLGDKASRLSYSITALSGAVYFILGYAIGSSLIFAQCLFLVGVLAIAFWRHFREDLTTNIIFLTIWIFFHVYQTVLISQGTLGLRIDYLGLLMLDSLLVFRNMCQFHLWKKNAHQIAIYALGIHGVLLTCAYSKPISLLIPALAFLGYSLLALEAARSSYMKRYGEAVMIEVQNGFLNLGFGLILIYIFGFITVYLQFEGLWNQIAIRRICESLGFVTLCYWIWFKPICIKETKIIRILGERLIDLLIGFTVLCVLAESPEIVRPFFWAVLALCLLMGIKYFQWPARLHFYSWIFLISSIAHVAFLTNSMHLPYLSYMEQFQLPLIAAIFLQFVYAYFAHSGLKNEESSKWRTFLKKQPSISVSLPIFVGIAFLFAFNFEKTLLTLLWVGLSCGYLVLGLLTRSKLSAQIAMSALVICSGRLLIFDLVQTNLSIRAVVFLGVGILMMAIGLVYKKYKDRIEIA